MGYMKECREAHYYYWRKLENTIMAQAGFEPAGEENEELWRRQGLWYGRQAALQTAVRELGELLGAPPFSHESSARPAVEGSFGEVLK
jgi:hypothetical protein